MSKRILVIGLLVFALSFAMVGTSFAITTSDITATNNASGVADKVYVTGLALGDIVKIYPSPTSTVVVKGSGTAKAVSAGVYNASITVRQLIPNTSLAPVTLYVGVTPKGSLTETTPRTSFSVALETATNIASVSSSVPVIVNNGLGVLDTVYITGLLAGDVVKLYDNNDSTKVLCGSATASKTGAVTIKNKELDGKTLYFTVTRTKPTTGASTFESTGFKGPFVVPAQVPTTLVNTTPTTVDQVYPTNIVVQNNYNVADTVYIYGFLAGDVVKLYADAAKKTLLTKVTAGTVKNAAYGGVTLKYKQLNATTGSVNVYVTVTRTKPATGPSLSESATLTVAVPAEGKVLTGVFSSNITVTNNKVGTADTIKVTGLIPGDIIKAYASADDDTVIGKATVATGATSATITIAQLGKGVDNVYVTVTRMKPTSGATLSESDRVSAAYIAEP